MKYNGFISGFCLSEGRTARHESGCCKKIFVEKDSRWDVERRTAEEGELWEAGEK